MEKDVLELKINKIVDLSKEEGQVTAINEDIVKESLDIVNKIVHSLPECFLSLSALNLLHAAIKRNEFKDSLYYGMINACVSRLVSRLISLDMSSVSLSINTKEKSAYIKIYGLQFKFNDISIGDDVTGFINKGKNTIVEWEGVNLENIAGELYLLAQELNTEK